MSYINLKDINNNEIFKGDTLNLFPKENQLISQSTIDRFNIDETRAFVKDCNDLNIIVNVDISFFSKGLPVYTLLDHFDLLIEQADNDKDEILRVTEEKSKKSKNELQSQMKIKLDSDSSYYYHHSFVHIKKEIKHMKDKGRRKNNDDNAVVLIGETSYPWASRLLIKMTKEAKEMALKSHNMLYEPEYGFKGDFTHLIVLPKKDNDNNYTLKFKAVDKNQNISLIALEDDFDERMNQRRIVRRNRNDEIEKIENQDITKEEKEILLNDITKKYKPLINEINEKRIVKEIPVDDFFIGMGNHLKIIQNYVKLGSTIEII